MKFIKVKNSFVRAKINEFARITPEYQRIFIHEFMYGKGGSVGILKFNLFVTLVNSYTNFLINSA